ncbi:cyclin-dependent kinase inhibitor 3-like [Hibiscus syriacus]|uniref:Cyclin-dependent kinase inhibitor 3-like n=1 Tax=Hibiscus syriacus TaxID=106335 RepID=A0A6A2Y3C8_HIBSY|nr:uncharacterized protein LOC120167713 [Hibiscus syriacus]KAE8675155.1 cyclin-dependent kinase inhibitor 3-like [Hibiscus syriacus]
MNLSSWFRRSVSGNSKNCKNSDQPQPTEQEETDEFLGVTQQLIDYVKSFTLDTFKNFPIQDSGSIETQTSSNVRMDLSDWQQRHAVLVLSKVKELSQIRFKLCPRHLKEEKFWRIYFMLVKIHVSEYELHAIQRTKLKSLAMTNEKTSDTGAYEVEMAERNQAASLTPLTP